MNQRENERTNNNVHPAVTGDDNGFDLSILEEMDDPDYTSEIVNLFMKDTPRQLKDIQSALAAGAYETVYKTAHKLKSSAGVIQANCLIQMLSELETIAKESRSNDQLNSLLKNAEQEYNRLEKKLKNRLK